MMICAIRVSIRPVVAYKRNGFIYLLSDVILREVNKIQPLKFTTTTAIGMQLKKMDY